MSGRPLRIAIDANVLEGKWGGIPKYLTRIADELIAGGDRVDLLANTRRMVRPLPGAHEVGIRVKGTEIWRNGFVPLWLARALPPDSSRSCTSASPCACSRSSRRAPSV